ncbi:MAG: hypothetical protein J6Y37_01110 [Paludibacteraceae bacterium]|nr:hypothetical protein [Paludibacteraceae bacterium]
MGHSAFVYINKKGVEMICQGTPFRYLDAVLEMERKGFLPRDFIRRKRRVIVVRDGVTLGRTDITGCQSLKGSCYQAGQLLEWGLYITLSR